MADPNSLLQTMKHFVATRKANPVLGWGSCDFLPLTNKAILAYLRRSDEAQMLIVCNLSGQPQMARLSLPEFAGILPKDVLTETTLTPITQADYGLSLTPYQYHWLKLS
jgi:maltose alpha-D-glucosyltransferase/alpha-amylase